jgi:ribosome production factor 2
MSKTGVVGMAGVGAPVRRKARVERLLRNRGPQLMEHTKRLITMKGVKSSEIVHDILLDFSRLAKPHCVSLTRKNEIFPFEDANSVEFLTQKNDCSLFALGSHSKKRPHNLILGRTFDGHILDMFEFGVEDFIPIDNFKETCHKALG